MNTDEHRSPEPQPKKSHRKDTRGRRGRNAEMEVLCELRAPAVKRLSTGGAELGVRRAIPIDDVETQCEDHCCRHINPPIQAAQREFVKACPDPKGVAAGVDRHS